MTEFLRLYGMLPEGDANEYWAVQKRGPNLHVCAEVSAKTHKPYKQSEYTGKYPSEAVRNALRALGVYLPEDTGLTCANTHLSHPEKLHSVAYMTRPGPNSGESQTNAWAVWLWPEKDENDGGKLCGYVGCEGPGGWYFVKNPGLYDQRDTRQPDLETAVIACYCRVARKDFDPRKAKDS